jgi:hypothetical protein
VGGHHARAQQRPAALDGRVDRDVHVDTGVVERLPEEHSLPVVADQHGDDRRDHLGAVRQPVRLHHVVPEVRQAVVQVARVVEHALHQLRALVRADDLERAERGTDRRGHRGGSEHERARLDAQEVDHVGGPGYEAAAGRERLRERAHAQVDLVLHVHELAGAGAAGSKHSHAVGLVDHQARAVLAAERHDVRHGGEVALHREHAVNDHQDAAAVALGALEHRLELVEPVVAVRADAGARHHDRVEDRGVVARVADHGVAGAEQRADRPGVRQVAGGEDERVLGAHELGQVALELEVERERAVQEARAGEAGAEALEGVAGGLLDALVAGEPEVVVRAEHDPLVALHVNHRPGRALEHPEVGHEVVVASSLELL